MAFSWFLYDGTGSTTDPLNYNTVAVPNCLQGSTICAIFAEVIFTGTPPKARPVITSTLAAQIAAADATNTPSPNVRLRP